jgi:hypothetical protein
MILDNKESKKDRRKDRKEEEKVERKRRKEDRINETGKVRVKMRHRKEEVIRKGRKKIRNEKVWSKMERRKQTKKCVYEYTNKYFTGRTSPRLPCTHGVKQNRKVFVTVEIIRNDSSVERC